MEERGEEEMKGGELDTGREGVEDRGKEMGEQRRAEESVREKGKSTSHCAINVPFC